MVYPHLYIRTNHGHIELANVTVVKEYDYDESRRGGGKFHGMVVEGTIVGGAETSRLFSATSTKVFPVGKSMKVDLYGKKPWHREPGRWEVSLECCG